MKQAYLFLYALSFLSFSIHAGKLPENFKKKETPKISFTENKGQVCDQNYKPRADVLFSGTDGQLTFHIKSNGISYQLCRVDTWKEENISPLKGMSAEDGQGMSKVPDKTTIYRIDANWLNTNTNFTKQTDEALPGCSNYYVEQCPNGALDVKSYKGITLKNIYNNINLHYYEKEGVLKYDYIVKPHTDYKQIQIEINGADIHINYDGSLLLKTSLGDILEGRPVAYQNGKKLTAYWKINKNILSFEVENYNSEYELVIDPPTRIWGTYYGAVGGDWGYGCTTDVIGNVYMSGHTGSNTGTMIATSGSHQGVLYGSSDAFLVKFTPGGVRLWGTYYGGTGIEFGRSCCSDSNGNIYMSGITSSTTTSFISTSGSHQASHGGGFYDAYLVKFNSSGIRQWGTYYGGAGSEENFSCTVDISDNIYIAGYTDVNSVTMIASPSSYQNSNGGGGNDAYLAKFDPNGVRLWATYYGGLGIDQGYSCAADFLGNVYLSGSTSSNTGTVIATSGSHQSSISTGQDAFLVKFDLNGVRQWGTYYGGTGNEIGNSCSIDGSGNVFLSGQTTTTIGISIATIGSHQSSHSGVTFFEGFLAKFDAGGIRQWGTYYGGVGDDFVKTSSTDTFGNIYIAGYSSTTSGTTIAAAGSHQNIFGGGSSDGFLAKFSTGGVRQWGTYYGGSGFEAVYSCATDPVGNLVMSGESSTPNGTAIATLGSHQSTYSGSNEAFLMKFDCCITGPPPPGVINGTLTACIGAMVTFSISPMLEATSYVWTLPVGWSGTSTSNTITVVTGTASGNINVSANNSCGTSAASSLSVTIIPYQTPTITVNSGNICIGQSFTMAPFGAGTYTFSSGSAVVSPTITSSYSVTGTSTAGCVSNYPAVSNVTVNSNPTITVNSGTVCSGKSFTIFPSGASTYTFSSGSAVVSPTSINSYSITGTSSVGCISTNTAVSTVTVIPQPTITVNSGVICVGQSFTITPSGASTYTFSSGSAVVSPTIGSSYSVTGASTAGCVSSNTPVCNVIVNPTPTISIGSSSVCSGSTGCLSASGSGIVNFNWSGPCGFTSAVQNPCFPFSSFCNCTYSVICTSAAGCTNIATTCINVYPNPTVTAITSNTLICGPPFQGTATLTGGGALTYSWNTSATTNIISASPSVTTTYSVTGTDANGCQNTAMITQSVSACTNVTSYEAENYLFEIFPNPTNGFITVVIAKYEAGGIEVYNLIGERIFMFEIKENKTEIDLSQQADGIYFIKIGNVTKKIIKE